MQLQKPPPWVVRAACGQSDPALFFPTRGAHADLAAAQVVCAGCPVRWDCLEFGWMERWGIWGGLSDRERRRLRRQHGTAQAAIQALHRAEVAAGAREAALRAKRVWKPAYLRQEVAS